MQEESSWHDRFSQSVFLKHFKQNSSRHLSVKQKYKISYIKKHVYKDRKEITHVEVGEEDIHHIYIYIYISKISTMYVNHGHKTSVKEAIRSCKKKKRGKHSP